MYDKLVKTSEKVQVEFEDGWGVQVAFDGAWYITNASGSKVATLEPRDIVEVMDKLGLQIVAKSE